MSLRIMMNYHKKYEDLNSEESKNLISILKRELSILCKRADGQNFKDVHILRLMNGSVIAEGVAEYSYPNNNSQIMFLNNDLELTLEKIFNDSNSFNNLSAALGNVSIERGQITMDKVEIWNITDIKPYVKCSLNFANLTEEIENGTWVCEGSCKKDLNFCNQRGKCLNEKNGPQCICDSSHFEKYYGDYCELYSRGAGFYAVIFGSLAAFALLVIVAVVMVVVLYRAKSKTSSIRKSSFFDDAFFDFSSRGGSSDRSYGHQNLSFTEDSDLRSFRPSSEYTSA